jgi:DNA-binding NarL/FixJ family response regulator
VPDSLPARFLSRRPRRERVALVNSARPTRVLLGNLEPMMLVGLQVVLAEDGVEAIGPERTPSRILAEAQRLQPDVVLLDFNPSEGGTLGAQIQRVAPHTKVIRWARDETVMEVLDPASGSTRVVPLTAREALRNELTGGRQLERAEE